MLTPQVEEPSVDFELAAVRVAHERQMLDRIVRFCDTAGCRRRNLLRYFGDPDSPWSCAACDCCVGPHAPPAEEVSLDRVMMMGSDFYEDEDDFDYNRQLGIPNIGIGKGSVIRKAIIDKNAHIGENVRILNEERIQNFDGPGYYIRDGIVIVPKNGILPGGTSI